MCVCDAHVCVRECVCVVVVVVYLISCVCDRGWSGSVRQCARVRLCASVCVSAVLVVAGEC